MELILLRHGKAEERGSRLRDEDRELTIAGRKKMNKVAAGLKILLGDGSGLQIWSSPLARAWQTAGIVAEVLGVEPVLSCGAAAAGDFDQLAAQWREAKAGRLIVVGHEPYLSLWTERLTGAVLEFRKGAAAGILLDKPEVPHGRLQWFMQPRWLRHLAKA